MNRTPNWKDLKLNNQCGICKHYKHFVKDGKRTARGKCELKSVYKMRTERCMKFEKGAV